MIVIIVISSLVILWLAAKPKKKAQSYVASPVIPAVLEWEQKEREKAAREAEKAERKAEKEARDAAKKEAARRQAVEDIPYCENQIELLSSMIEDAKADLQTAKQRVQYDNAMNEHGAIITEKVVKQHIAARDKAMRKVLSLEKQIRSAETKLEKARQVMVD